jgi:uncharacterized membrane protein YkoI
MRTMAWLVAGLIVALAGPAVRADEEKIPLDKVPKAVMDAAKKKFSGAEWIGASTEKEDGKTVYEVELKHKGQHIDATFNEDGSLVSLEKEIKEAALPKAVSGAIAKKYPGAKYQIIEEVWHVKDGKEFLDYYEAVVATGDKKKFEVEVTADGTIKKTEEKKGEKD